MKKVAAKRTHDDWVDDVPTSPKDHDIFHVGTDWDFSEGFWDRAPVKANDPSDACLPKYMRREY